MPYRIDKELDIPREAALRPIPDIVLRAFGIDPAGRTPVEIGLAWVVLAAHPFDGQFVLHAIIEGTRLENDIDVVGQLTFDRDTPPESIMEEADSWLRQSRKVAWIPHPVIESESVIEGSLRGAVLIRPT